MSIEMHSDRPVVACCAAAGAATRLRPPPAQSPFRARKGPP